MRIAITRPVSPSIVECQLTFQERQPIDFDLANQQHRDYEQCLVALGCKLDRLPAEPDLPDAVFVEDTAVVLGEVAILMRPGAESRRPEVRSVAEKLKTYRRLLRIEPPGTMDGGDVLCVGRQIFVGRSRRTNAAGIAQLQNLVQDYGYCVQAVEIRDCLHLKSAVTQVGRDTLLIDPTRVDPAGFEDFNRIETDPGEHHAANALLVGETVIYPRVHVRTRQRLENYGITIRTVNISELAKAESGVTCSSLVFES
ncbi:MAG TPA: dimethylargininase [Anaerolineae bacterium]|nr:dimethylargininase [Anaerolineae bacterium]